MIRIKTVNLGKLLVQEVNTLAVFVLNKLEVLLVGKHIPQKMVDTVTASKKDFDGAVGSNANPDQLKELHAKDDLCDSSLQELKGLAVSASLRRDEKVRKAGERVLTAIRHRGYNMQDFRISVEIAAMRQLLDDIKASPELTADIATIGAAEVVARMDVENADTEAFWQKVKMDDTSGSLSSYEANRRLRSSLSQVFQYLDSVADYEPEVAAAIEQINGAIEPLAVAVKSRATIRANKKKEEEEKNKEKDKEKK
jgi:acetolactate synthase regulatory subunit